MGINNLYFKGTYALKPREKARALGMESLSDGELLALLFETGSLGEGVLELCERYLKEKGGLRGIFLSESANLESYGVKDAKIYRILAVREILKRVPARALESVQTSRDLYEMTKGFFLTRQEEAAVIFFLSAEKEILRREEWVSDSKNSILLNSKSLVYSSLVAKAKFVVIVHNHPSESLTPSPSDLEAVRDLHEKLMQARVVLYDCVIVSIESCYSMREHGDGIYGDKRGFST